MASSSYAKSLLGGLPAEIKTALARVFEYLLDGNVRFGPVEHQTRTTNFAGVYLLGTTASVAATEFTLAHGLATVPRVLWPVLDPQAVGGQLVSLTVTRAADGVRVYLSSPSTSAPIAVYCE
jgi:hypothetical protein